MPFIIKTNFKLALWIGSLLMVSGCSLTSLMFYPLQNIPMTPDKIGVQYQAVSHASADGTALQSWWLPSDSEDALTGSASHQAKGSILFLHGNAQNISYHQFNVNWLPKSGYNVFMLGYRQFGESEGLAKLPDIFLDVHAGLDWILSHQPNQPVYILGQSMGASLAVYGLASYSQADKVNGVILDAAFDSYPDMAAYALQQNWLTWLFQFPAYTITRDYDPERWITKWPAGTRLLMMHSAEDQIVPYQKGQALFGKAKPPKKWLENHGPHIATFKDKAMREGLIAFLESINP